MRPLPSSKYSLPRWKKPLRKALKREEKKIRKAYSSIPFSPSVPECTPIRAYFDLYSHTDPEVLYAHLQRLNKQVSFHAFLNNALVGLLSGVFSGALVTCIGIIPNDIPVRSRLISLICVTIFLYLLFLASLYFWFPASVVNPSIEKRLDMMYDILELEKYFSYK